MDSTASSLILCCFPLLSANANLSLPVPLQWPDMIAHLRGKLLAKHPNQAVVETAGVGYDVIISVPTYSDLPAVVTEVSLHIHTHAREDLIALYGFVTSA